MGGLGFSLCPAECSALSPGSGCRWNSAGAHSVSKACGPRGGSERLTCDTRSRSALPQCALWPLPSLVTRGGSWLWGSSRLPAWHPGSGATLHMCPCPPADSIGAQLQDACLASTPVFTLFMQVSPPERPPACLPVGVPVDIPHAAQFPKAVGPCRVLQPGPGRDGAALGTLSPGVGLGQAGRQPGNYPAPLGLNPVPRTVVGAGLGPPADPFRCGPWLWGRASCHTWCHT